MDNVNSTSTGKFQDYVSSSAVICHSNASSSEKVIDELVKLVCNRNPPLDRAAVRESVYAREALFPTVIAPGLAMPHARINNLDKLVVALATSREGVTFGSGSDSELVKVVVLVLSPADDPGLHLQVVSALAKEFRDLEKIDKLAALDSVAQVVEFFGSQVRLPDCLKVGDLASPVSAVLLESDSLEFAFRKFAESRSEQMPVLDNAGNLKGVITLKNILHYNVPEKLLNDGDLTALYDLKPYAEVLARAGAIQVRELMNSDYQRVVEELPAAKLIKMFLDGDMREILVVDRQGRLRGELKLRDFVAKIFWE